MSNQPGDSAAARVPGKAAKATPAKPSAARARILAAADRLFYNEGIRAVGVDRVVAESEVTRVTFYRHFPSKDDLIVAYLSARSQREHEQLAAARAAMTGDPRAVLRAIVSAIVAESCAPGFRGCPYINAAAEYADREHPVRKVVSEHRAWFKQQMAELMAELDHPQADSAADQMVLLRDGAMVGGYLSDPGSVSRALLEAGRAVVAYRGQLSH